MKKRRKNLKKQPGRTVLALLLVAALAVGGMTTVFATEDDTSADAAVTEEAAETANDVSAPGVDASDNMVEETDTADDVANTENAATGTENAIAGTEDAAAGTEDAVADTEDAAAETASPVSAVPNPDYDPSYGLYGGYDGQDSMDDPDRAGACVGWDIATRSSITGDSGLWWIDNYYVGESSQYDVKKTTDFSLKYQIEFHASEDIAAGAVEIVVDASLGTYRDGSNIIPTELGIPYGTPDDYTATPASPFNYYYKDADGNLLTEEQAQTASGVQIVLWNYKDIVSGSNAMVQVLYKSLDVMQIPDMTEWSLEITAKVDIGDGEDPNIEIVEGNTLSGLVDTAATITSVTKTAYTATSTSYTPELYTQSQVSHYINGTIGEPYVSNFSDYIYIVWYVTLRGSATQAYEITIDEDTFGDSTGAGSIVGYRVNTSASATSSGISRTYGTDSDGNPTLSFASSMQRSFSVSFYVVTAYDADTYLTDTSLENDVTVTVHPVDGYDDDTTKSDSAMTTWGEYVWKYIGDIIGITKYDGTSGVETRATYSAHKTLYELQRPNGEDTGEYTFRTVSTDRGYAFTHYTTGTNVGECIEGSYYTTTTVDDALYIYPNGGTTPARMLGKDDYYFSSVKIKTTDNDYDVWEDKTAGALEYDGVDQSVYIYAMYYDEGDDADADGWEYVATVPFSTSGTMTYTFSDGDLARQPYRVKAVHSTANYATDCTITVGVTLRCDSPMIQWCYDTYGENLTSIKIENLSGVAGQTYNVPGYADGQYFQDIYMSGGNYSEKDTETGETLTAFTESLYKTLLMRNNAYATLTELIETSDAYKSVLTENDTANARVLANYYLMAYEAYYVTGVSTVDALEDDGIHLPARNEVSYYDLLPYGMQFNPNTTVVAGRVVSMNSGGTWITNTRAWDTAGVTVEVSDEDVITNWNDTGRTMVIFHIYYDGEDASAFYNVPSDDQDLWYQGFALYFQAYYDWADMDAVDAEYNIAAYIAENVNDESEQLLGSHDSTVYKDDGSANLTAQYGPFKGISDLNGDGITDLYTNMYASTSTTTNVAVSSSDSIKKQVRADDDAVAEYGDTAVVGNGRGYTYEVSLTNTFGATLSDVVFYDRLEYSVEDGRVAIENATNPNSVFQGLPDDEIYDNWKGTFNGVSLSALTDVGIDPIVYYNANRDAVISENGDGGTAKTTPADVLTEANGWYTEERFVEEHGSLSEVKAIAIDISTTAKGDPFTLETGESLSYQIHMIAPDGSEDVYAFNNPSYYSVSTSFAGEETSSTDIGNTARVELGEAGILAVEKEFSNTDHVPESMRKTKFTFEITRRGKLLAGQEYMVYDWDEDAGEWISSGVIGATDAKGQFTLKAGQKAVFTKLVDIEDVAVTEIESVLWISDEAEYELKEEEKTAYYLFENSYRSPVYLYKTVETTDLASEDDLAHAEFTFRLEADTNGNGEYEPYVGAYLYVKEVLTDGSSPIVDTTKGDGGYGYTDNGEVTLKIGDIIVFFPCDESGNYLDVPYRIEEIETGDEWVCFDDTASGTTTDTGKSNTITNYYKYRSLIITKDLYNYDHDLAECADAWTFMLTDAKGDPVIGNHWYMIDVDGNPVYTDVDGDEVLVEGYLDENGCFTFTGAGSGRRVVVEGLVEDEQYTLTETGYEEELYEQVNEGAANVTMPVYAISRSVTITNKYLMKDLSVEKLVLTDDEGDSIRAHEFTFTLEKYDPENENADDDGYVPVGGAAYTVDGEERVTDEDGTFKMTHGQTAYFDDLGYQGDQYRVTETRDADYLQIYPTDNAPHEESLSGDGASMRFINGDFDNVVTLTKNLVGLDEVGEDYVNIVKSDNTTTTLAGEEGDMFYTVEVTFGVYDGEDCVTTDEGALIDYMSDNASFPYVYIKVNAVSGTYTVESYNGGEITESLAPYDYIYISKIGGYTVKASESADMERVFLNVSDSMAGEIGSDQILSEGDVMSGSAVANEDIVLVNKISSANKQSEIYKLMTDASDEVPAGSQITFIVEIYDAASGTWSPASGIPYIKMDGYRGETKAYEEEPTAHDTAGCWPTSGVLTTGSDGKITLTKTDEGYPYIRFIEDVVYANVCDDVEDGTLRIVETSSGTDDAWGLFVGYDAEGWIGGPSLAIACADTFYNGNDETMRFEVEKEMADDTECDDDFTFYLRQVLSASASPITSMDEILEARVGAGVSYMVYDVESGERIREGMTDANGAFLLKAGEYAVFFVPEDTTWYVYEAVNPGYPLYSAEANDDPDDRDGKWGYAENASIVDETNGLVQNAHPVYPTGVIILTLTDGEDGTPLAGGTFDLYKDGSLMQSGLVTDKKGQIIVKGCAPGEYYFEETKAPSGGYILPDPETSDSVTVPDGLTAVTEYEVEMENFIVTVNYAVKLWGIKEDTYYDEDGLERKAGLTFGPATGADHLNDCVSRGTVGAENHPSLYCIHYFPWDLIISWSEFDPTVFSDCLKNGCTKAVALTPNDTLFDMETVRNMRNQNYTGDGVSTLYYLLNGTGSSLYPNGAIWNDSHTGYSDTDPANIYSRSRIRATLTGDGADAKAWVANGKNDYYGTDTLCDESNCLFSCFPENLQDAIVKRATYNTGNASVGTSANDKTTYDKLFLFSVREMGISNAYDDAGGFDYGVNSTSDDRLAYEFSDTSATVSSPQYWWTRSRYSNNYDYAYSATPKGSTTTGVVENDSGLSPGFCLRGPDERTIT